MDKQHNLKLVDGDFTPEDALEVVSCLLQSKINFHHGRALSLEERFGVDPAHSHQRVIELKAAQRELRELIDHAKRNNLQLSLESIISLTVHAGSSVEA